MVVVSADDVTSDVLLPWVGSGFLASGAAATDETSSSDVATPFDRRRHGMVVGMGAAAFVVESAEAVRERGMQPICEVLGLDHRQQRLPRHPPGRRAHRRGHGAPRPQAEARGVDRTQIAPQTVFVSHETYTPARGGSAAAEINALRRVFGAAAEPIVITNTKGFTGHAMGAGIEDVVAIKALETGIVPPVPNYKEPDPELGTLNLSLRRGLPGELRPAPGRRLRLPGRHDPAALDADARRPSARARASSATPTASWTRPPGSACSTDAAGRAGRPLEVDHRRLRVVDAGARWPRSRPGAPAARSRTPAHVAGRPAPSAALPATARPRRRSPHLRRRPPRHRPRPPGTRPAAAAAPPATRGAVDPVVAEVVGIVSRDDGLPAELLDVDLDLEADLGVDTVKQAEVFAAVRERFNVERDDNVALRDFPTLTHVVGWVRDKTGIQPVAAARDRRPCGAQPPPARTVAAAATTPVADEVTDASWRSSRDDGLPAELLDVDLDLEADLGVDTVKQAEVFAAVRERFNVERDDNVAPARLPHPDPRHRLGPRQDRHPARRRTASSVIRRRHVTGRHQHPPPPRSTRRRSRSRG